MSTCLLIGLWLGKQSDVLHQLISECGSPVLLAGYRCARCGLPCEVLDDYPCGTEQGQLTQHILDAVGIPSQMNRFAFSFTCTMNRFALHQSPMVTFCIQGVLEIVPQAQDGAICSITGASDFVSLRSSSSQTYGLTRALSGPGMAQHTSGADEEAW